mgnify:CR=1 FL=1
MKKTFSKKTGSKLILAFVAAIAIAGVAPLKSMANRNNDTIEIVSAENTSSVQFAGTENNSLLFNVKINNTAGEKFTLIVTNEEGEIVFIKGYADKNFAKQIKLMQTAGGNRYHFSIWRAGNSSDYSKLVEVINAANF